MDQVDFSQVAALFAVLFTFWFGAAAPWWALKAFNEVATTGTPDERQDP